MIKLYIESSDGKVSINENKLKFVSYVYAHGKLEEKAGFDLLNELKTKHFDKRRNIFGEDCIAILPNGEEIKAKFFFWHVVHVHTRKLWFGETYRSVWRQARGLLVAKDDKKAIKYATEQYNEKSKYL